MRNIGDKVFVAWATSHCGVEKECPVCFGQTMVKIVLGDLSTVAVKCGYCTHTPGKAIVREARCGVTECEVIGVEKNGEEFRYRYSPSVYDEVGIFDDESEAQSTADQAFPTYKEHADRIAAQIPHDKWESSSWSVGYHRAQIKAARRSIEWHQQQLNEGETK